MRIQKNIEGERDVHEFFIDTPNVEEIRKANDMDIVAGATTNPFVIVKKYKNYTKVLVEIDKIVDGPISGTVKVANNPRGSDHLRAWPCAPGLSMSVRF